MQALTGFGRKYQFRLPFLWISDESEKEQLRGVQSTMNTTLLREEGNRKVFLYVKKKVFKSSKSWH